MSTPHPEFRTGQRWTSVTEPELGLGTLVEVEDRLVEIAFDASESRRRYAKATAPLQRVRFHVGDLVQARSGARHVVTDVEENDGLLTYVAGAERIPEGELAPAVVADDPAQRLLAGEVDPSRVFALRQEALEHQGRLRASPVRGLLGARIDLIPHQIFIASEIARREVPRVLLADEVGLGKTIEACLALHRWILVGDVDRALVVVPEHLVYQWLVELLRRFNLRFTILDEERCAGIERGGDGGDGGDGGGDEEATPADERNPFLEEPLVITSLPFLLGDARRAAQAVAAGWDALVVDEAHHLVWKPGDASPGYALVEALARRAERVLLLTGTPAQLGDEGHFARLRLLDPERYRDLESHRAEAAGYVEVAARIESLSRARATLPDDGSIVGGADEDETGGDGAGPSASAAAYEAEATGPTPSSGALLDLYGPGRVMFRNTRASMGGFPRRLVLPAPLEATTDPQLLATLAGELDLRGRRARGELASYAPMYTADPRLPWLAALLRSLNPEKVLVLVQTPEQVVAIGEALSRVITVKRAVFHEGLTLLQRDRNAAYFAEPDGARMLLCSEIGSEGRNFQFAHHLVLFDLPLDPELLEQRIGRLDRIGQTTDVSIHVPYVRGSAGEVLFRWYHEGLDAFTRPAPDGNALRERFGERVADLARSAPAWAAREVDALVEESVAYRHELAERVARGRDRLLERSSFRPERAATLVSEIAMQDADPALEDFMQRALEHFGVEVEDLGERTYRLATERLAIDAFPGLPVEGATATFSRARALAREDLTFLTWDHPMVVGAIDLLVSSTRGSSSLGFVEGEGPREVVLEAIFVIESPAPRRLGLERFLPGAPIRVEVDRDLAARELAAPRGPAAIPVADAPRSLPEHADAALRERLVAMLARAREAAEVAAKGAIERSRSQAHAFLTREIDRLVALAARNPEVRAEEIERLRERRAETDQSLAVARVRLDAVRAFWRGSLAARGSGRVAGARS